MSKYVSIQTTLSEESLLRDALKDLKCEILKTRKIRTLLGRSYEVDVAVTTPFGIVGFVRNASGTYDIAGDDMILAKKNDFLNQLAQRYAYRLILQQAEKAGFRLVQEETNPRQVMKLVLRKWS